MPHIYTHEARAGERGEQPERSARCRGLTRAPELSSLVGLVCLAVIGRGVGAARHKDQVEAKASLDRPLHLAHRRTPADLVKSWDHLPGPELAERPPVLARGAGAVLLGELREGWPQLSPILAGQLRQQHLALALLLDQDVARRHLAAAAAAAAQPAVRHVQEQHQMPGRERAEDRRRQGLGEDGELRPETVAALGDRDDLQIEDQDLIRADPASGTPRAVGELARNVELPVITGPHELQGLSPAFDNLVGRERRGLPAFAR
mmetsp:Transcript_34501/g.87551  ORF Transcript_34501/g.87551 Transcript_34501/m.87551 type:complete len:262 (+) Transcript_34501:266-1051(+)